MKPKRYRLISDNDGHKYIIEDGQEKDFYKWVEAMENYGETELDFQDCQMTRNNLTFTDPQGWE